MRWTRHIVLGLNRNQRIKPERRWRNNQAVSDAAVTVSPVTEPVESDRGRGKRYI